MESTDQLQMQNQPQASSDDTSTSQATAPTNVNDLQSQLALYQQQQQQFMQQLQAQQGQAGQMGQLTEEQRRQFFSNPMMMMPQLMMNPALLQRMTSQGNSHVATGTEASGDEEPVYVNAKQYHRIMIRRQQRAKLDAKLGGPKQRKAYLHHSRHRHAMRRPRGPGGRFLTRDEIQALKDGTLNFEDVPNKAAKPEK